MPLPTIGVENVLDSDATTNNGSRPLGHSAIHGASSNDNASIFSRSSGSTMSNLIGSGRVLGNVISLAGKHLERTVGDLAHKAGFGPEAIYQQICTLYAEDWKRDDRKASMLQKLCFKLFEYSSSVVDSTRISAITRWGDILRDQHEIFVWLSCSQQERMAKHANALLHVIEELQSTINIFSDFQDAVLSKTLLLIKCHSMGLNFISLSRARLLIVQGDFQVDWTGVTDIHKEEIEKWDVSFQHLLESLSDPSISALSRWYIDLWSSQIDQGNMHVSFALQSCLTLRSVLKAVDPSQTDRWETLAVLGKALHEYFVGISHSRTMLLGQWDDFVLCDGVPVHISTILNDLVRSYHRVYFHELGIVPDLTCMTMLGSTDLISADVKEKIKGFLKDLQNDDEGKDTAFTKMMFLRACNRLFERALSELDDTECLDKLLNVTSFTDETSRWTILQLGDILQSLPEVYTLLITLGHYHLRDSVKSLRWSLEDIEIHRYPGTLMNLRSLLACHATGLSLTYGNVSLVSFEASEFIIETAPFDYNTFRKSRDRFVPYLMNNVTFNPLILYLKCIFQDSRTRSIWYSFLSCSIVHGALLTKESIPQENRSAMEELCRTMQNSIIVKLRTSIGSSRYIKVTNVRHALRTVYADLIKERHVRTFKDEAEVYLLQLCNLLFEIIFKAGYKWCDKRDAVIELSQLFESRNVFGWFLSIRGPDAEESISRLLKYINNLRESHCKEVRHHEGRFSHLETHGLGVVLLAPRHEKLHFEGAGLTKYRPTRSSKPPLTQEQRERWINAFKTLAANLRSSDSYLMNISLFYFANCPLPYEADPMLNTALALEACEGLQQAFTEGQQLKSANKEDLSRAVSRIHTCLRKRVGFVRRSCKDLPPNETPTFYGTPFEFPKMCKVRNDLAKLSKEKEKLGSGTPKLLPIPDC